MNILKMCINECMFFDLNAVGPTVLNPRYNNFIQCSRIQASTYIALKFVYESRSLLYAFTIIYFTEY